MCCEPNVYTKKEIKGECPDCGVDIDEDGHALENCSYSPVVCETCGWQPCDDSC